MLPPCTAQLPRTVISGCSSLRSSRRLYAYSPRPHSISTPKRNKQVDNVPQDPQLFHNFFTTFADLQTPMPDSLAIQIFTHKSFSHGKLGYNEKLAFLGRRVLYLRISEHLIQQQQASSKMPSDEYSLNGFTSDGIEHVLSLESLGLVAEQQDGLQSLLRWKPKDEKDLEGSGIRKIAAETLMAAVGAIELQFGAAKAKQVVQRRVIPRLKLQQISELNNKAQPALS